MPPVRKTSVSFYLPCRSPTVTPPSSLTGLPSCWSPCCPSCHTPTYSPLSPSLLLSSQNNIFKTEIRSYRSAPWDRPTASGYTWKETETPYDDVLPPPAQTASPTLRPIVALPLSTRPLIPQPTWPSLPPLLQHATLFCLLSLYVSRFLYVEYSPHLPPP